MLSDENYLLVKSNQLIANISNNPSNWPVILGLTPSQRIFVADEIDETYATHRFNSDLFGSDIRVMNSLCTISTGVAEPDATELVVFPNPAADIVQVANASKWYVVYDMDGKIVLQSNAGEINMSRISPGMYIIQCENRSARMVRQ